MLSRTYRPLQKHMVRSFTSAAPTANQSLFEKVFLRSKAPSVPMDQLYPGLSALKTPTNDAVVTPQSTTLPNGMRVVSVDSDVPITSVGCFIDAGSRYETRQVQGITNFVEMIAFKSTTSRSEFKIVRDMIGASSNLICSSSRENLCYAGDTFRSDVGSLVEALGDSMLNNAFLPHELEEAKKVHTESAAERDETPDMQLMEAVHAAAYNNNTLGQSLFALPDQLAAFTPELLREYFSLFLHPKRMLVAGVGVDHATLVEHVERSMYLPINQEDRLIKQPAEYTGGDCRIHKQGGDGLAHVALAFETCSWHGDDLIAMCVLQQMLGGGGSFSAGGPGKGMHSRLYKNVLNKYAWVEQAHAFTSIFSDSGLFGVCGIADGENTDTLVKVLTDQLLATAGDVSDVELDRSKTQLASNMLFQLETRSMQLEDLGKQMLLFDRVPPAEELIEKIGAVTAKDIQRVASKMLKTPVSVAGFGDLTKLPRWDVIQNGFKN